MGINNNINAYKPRRRKKWLLVVMFILIVGLTSSIIYTVNNADELGATPRGKIMEVSNLSQEEADKVVSILKKCGIDQIDYIEEDSLLKNMNEEGERGYRISYKSINNIILYIKQDNTANMISWADNNLYSDGEAVSKITDHIR